MGTRFGLRQLCALFAALAALAPAALAQDPKTASIVGHLILPSGAAGGRGLKVTLWTDRSPLMTTLAGQSGEFRFYPLSAAEYSVQAVDESGRFDPVGDTVRVLPGQQSTVNLYLRERTVRDVPEPVAGVASVSELDDGVPRDARREYARGAAFAKEGKAAEAIAAFERAIAIFPGYTKAHNDLGVQYLKAGRLRDAGRHFETAIRLDPLSFNPHLNLGILRIGEGEYAKAADALREALRLDSTQPAAYLALGIALFESNDLGGAVDQIRRALLFGRDRYPAAHYYLGATYASSGDRARARDSLKTYLEKAPDGPLAESARALLAELGADPR